MDSINLVNPMNLTKNSANFSHLDKFSDDHDPRGE
jgi:hypothetical protein